MDSSSFLIKEYETLYNDSRKKFSEVGKSCKSTIKILKGSKKNVELICTDLLKPIQSIFDLGAQRLYPNALSILGKICMTTYLTKEGAMKTVEILK